MPSIKIKNYDEQAAGWPQSGRHILANVDREADTIVLYQAFKPSIAQYALEQQQFGGPDYSWDRMSWVKTNYLWMMYRSGWASKPGQEMVLALHVTREGFEQILSRAYTGPAQKAAGLEGVEVRLQVTISVNLAGQAGLPPPLTSVLQWDPDHDPLGGRCARRAVQLGLRGATLRQLSTDWLVKVEDMGPLVKEGWQRITQGASIKYIPMRN